MTQQATTTTPDPELSTPLGTSDQDEQKAKKDAGDMHAERPLSGKTDQKAQPEQSR